ncbi:MAG: hypothetical protein JST16_05170 [Bdellovibrionales bacterium]|nr:hypothetical protein [Bdellovibrionales bacterium]
MNQTKPNQILEIDLKIQYRARVINIRLHDVLKWLVPLIVVGLKTYKVLTAPEP